MTAAAAPRAKDSGPAAGSGRSCDANYRTACITRVYRRRDRAAHRAADTDFLALPASIHPTFSDVDYRRPPEFFKTRDVWDHYDAAVTHGTDVHR